MAALDTGTTACYMPTADVKACTLPVVKAKPSSRACIVGEEILLGIKGKTVRLKGYTTACDKICNFTLGYSFLLDSMWDFQKQAVILRYGAKDAVLVRFVYAKNRSGKRVANVADVAANIETAVAAATAAAATAKAAAAAAAAAATIVAAAAADAAAAVSMVDAAADALVIKAATKLPASSRAE
ncbi:uncharacterized protein LOC119574913 [Penaeus monodon]|uniref:uncharacterized protein LOC119574913 n=1 Tax=Penaeus monodon TaxID=6687 RepID=UPI0018A7797B|nr:uncharacterized protein LOC119574913 [Penaeus monodon]